MRPIHVAVFGTPLAMALVLPGSAWTAEKSATKPAPVAEKTSEKASGEAAIRAGEAAFVAAFNRGDATAVAALWTPNGSLLDDRGRLLKGRKAIQDEYVAFFKANPGAKIQVAIQSIEMPTDDTAVEDGLARVLTKDGAPPVASRYTAVHVLANGKWLMASVRESAIELPSSEQPLRELQWLVGTWRAQDGDAVVQSTIRWLDGRSLQREYTVLKRGVKESSGLQIIGWDPRAKRPRSWSFDSSGGMGTGMWTPVAQGWRIDSTGMLADGATTASEDYLIRVPDDDGVFGFRSVNRRVENQRLPDLREVVFDRRPEER